MKDRIKEVAQKIVELTKFGQTLHVNDILPDLQTIADEANKQGERTATGRAVKIAEEEIHKLRTIPKDKRPDAHTVLALVKRDIQNNVSK